MSDCAADAKEITTDTVSHTDGTQPLNTVQNTSERDITQTQLSRSTTMPSIVSVESDDNNKPEPIFKIEPGTETVNLVAVTTGGEPAQLENDASASLGGRDHCAFIGEEPLEIQCGENTALLYVSKLCQGSKGPCILFNNEWLTPNELQYISGRETAKDWKRSIRFKGKSLKSLIARGLIKVHPPICDCLGCRISSPVNRGRLASKCGIAPPSPRNRKRDASKSLSCWSHEELEAATAHRHYSTSDIDGYTRHALVNGYKDARPESNSSATSECSEGHDDNPFSPKRPRSSSPDITLIERPRRASDSSVTQFMHPQKDYDKALSLHRMIQLQEDKDLDVNKEQTSRNDKNDTNKSRSAFRTVQQDGTSSMTPAVSDGDSHPKDIAALRAGKIKQGTSGPTSPFLPPYTQYGSAMVSPTSPRLVPDPLLFGSPHGSNIYHHALRAGYHGVPQLPRNLMQYRLLPPPGTGNPPGLPIQSQLLMQDLAAMSSNNGKIYDKKSRVPEENGVPHKRRRSSNENSDNDKSSHSVFSDDETGSPKKENGHVDRSHVSVIHKSPANSPLTIDAGSDVKNSPSSRTGCSYKPHRLIPKLRLNTDESIVQWDVNQVCEFISSLTGSTEIVNEFKEQCIDGQSLILLKEDHLLNKLGIKLGPALKILAHIQKLLEKEMDIDLDNGDSG